MGRSARSILTGRAMAERLSVRMGVLLVTYDWPANWKERADEEKQDEQSKRIVGILSGQRCPGVEDILKKLRGEIYG